MDAKERQPATETSATNYTIQEAFQSQGRLRFNKEEFAEALTAWVVKSDQSFMVFCMHPSVTDTNLNKLKVVQSDYFRRMIEILNPNATIPAANTVRNRILKMHAEQRGELKATLETLDSKISLTTDIWTSPSGVPYLCLTGHFITTKWVLESVLLDFKAFVGSCF